MHATKVAVLLVSAVKAPQIVKIILSRSTENLSYLAFLLELLGATFSASYNYAKQFPFRYDDDEEEEVTIC